MQYISTRGEEKPADFSQLLLAGAAPDGGLYMPAHWPQLSMPEIAALAGKPFAAVAAKILCLFAGTAISENKLAAACEEAYANFSHKDVCPLTELAPDLHLLELFHGPTFAFKDVAMQVLARLIEGELAQSREKITVLCATSGDTGGAAVSAFAHAAHADVVVLFPYNRISDVQRRQITASNASNIFPIAVEGDFDDAQAIVKELFADAAFAKKHRLVSVNSINWARIAAQVTYYFTSALRLGALQKPVSFCVPTGNFGDIFAGFVAKKMGLPVSRLIIATNQNDILVRVLESGVYEIERVTPTTSPSMDIQVSSNFERLLFEASSRDAARTRALMKDLREKKRFVILPEILEKIRAGFSAASASEAEVEEKIRNLHAQTGRFIDPHTAVALVAASKARKAGETMIVLSTAHPAKFPQAVEKACGLAPPVPKALSQMAGAKENYIVLPANTARIRDYLETA